MDAKKRRDKIMNRDFQTIVSEYFYKKANDILLSETPDADELAFSKALFAGNVKAEDMSRIVAYNSSIGSAIDVGTEISEGDIEYAVLTESRFTLLAAIYKNAGVI